MRTSAQQGGLTDLLGIRYLGVEDLFVIVSVIMFLRVPLVLFRRLWLHSKANRMKARFLARSYHIDLSLQLAIRVEMRDTGVQFLLSVTLAAVFCFGYVSRRPARRPAARKARADAPPPALPTSAFPACCPPLLPPAVWPASGVLRARARVRVRTAAGGERGLRLVHLARVLSERALVERDRADRDGLRLPAADGAWPSHPRRQRRQRPRALRADDGRVRRGALAQGRGAAADARRAALRGCAAPPPPPPPPPFAAAAAAAVSAASAASAVSAASAAPQHRADSPRGRHAVSGCAHMAAFA